MFTKPMIAFLILVLCLLTACGGDDETPQVQGAIR